MRAAAVALALSVCACTSAPRPLAPWRGDLVLPADVDAAVQGARTSGVDTIVLALHDLDVDATAVAAARAVRAAGLRLGYWLEIGRSPALAEARPELMASLQGHGEWRRAFPDLSSTDSDDGGQAVFAVWPWVPVVYAEAFTAHRARVQRQLAALPAADVVFLNDLQGPPAACGCGNVLCRWATDYTLGGAAPQRTAPATGPDAAARFVGEVQAMVPQSRVVPVWVTECEAADTRADGACNGVGCYHGACWREFDRQWSPLQQAAPQIALLLPYRAFGRDLPRFGRDAGWVGFAIEHLRARSHGQGRDLPAASLVAVVQGWDDADDIAAQERCAHSAGVHSVLVARTEIVQTFEPRLRAAK